MVMTKQSTRKQRIALQYASWRAHAPFLYDHMSMRLYGQTERPIAICWFDTNKNTSQWKEKKQLAVGGTATTAGTGFLEILQSEHASTENILHETIKDIAPYVEKIIQYENTTQTIHVTGKRKHGRRENGQCTKNQKQTQELDEDRSLGRATVSVMRRVDIPYPIMKLKTCPQKTQIMAARLLADSVMLYDMSEMTGKERNRAGKQSRYYQPGIELCGLQDIGSNLTWSPMPDTILASADELGTIALWDINANTLNGSNVGITDTKHKQQLNALIRFRSPKSIQDIAFATAPGCALLASVSDFENVVRLWDIREQRCAITANVYQSHASQSIALNAVAWRPNSCQFAVGGDDALIRIFDSRNMRQPLRQMRGAKRSINSLQWNSDIDCLLAGTAEDGRVYVWNCEITNVNCMLNVNELREAPPELMFIHGGHVKPCIDIDWANDGSQMLASTSDDFTVQIWCMNSGIISKSTACPDIVRGCPQPLRASVFETTVNNDTFDAYHHAMLHIDPFPRSEATMNSMLLAALSRSNASHPIVCAVSDTCEWQPGITLPLTHTVSMKQPNGTVACEKNQSILPSTPNSEIPPAFSDCQKNDDEEASIEPAITLQEEQPALTATKVSKRTSVSRSGKTKDLLSCLLPENRRCSAKHAALLRRKILSMFLLSFPKVAAACDADVLKHLASSLYCTSTEIASQLTAMLENRSPLAFLADNETVSIDALLGSTLHNSLREREDMIMNLHE